ncbi:MAG: cytochrome c-type biogenesis protein CcmH [Chloroflexi bacterium]|nr:cytochrome c-type biogenesis protein CcmH [Chloroflexota bacterium]
MKAEIGKYKAKMSLGMLIALVTLSWFAATPIRAQGPRNIDDEVNRIAKGLYCPVCPNTPLDVCGTQACIDWRADIKTMVQQGKTEQEIRDTFVARFGPQVLGAPPAEGFNWLAYILPIVGILLGTAVAWFTVHAWLVRRTPATAGQSFGAPEIPKEYADRIKQDLNEL